jgi:hypothetical protein
LGAKGAAQRPIRGKEGERKRNKEKHIAMIIVNDATAMRPPRANAARRVRHQ